GAVEILMGPRRNAKRPGSANLVIDRLELQIVVEDLDSAVTSVPNINVALRVGRDGVRKIELAPLRSLGANRRDVSPVLVVLDDPRIAISVGDENIPGGVPRDIGRPVECIRLRRRLRGARRRRRFYPFNRFGPPAQKHDDSPLGIELDNHVRPLIDGPNIVLWIDPYRMSEREAIQTLTDLADIFPILIEFKQTRLLASGVDKNMPFGIRRNTNTFAKVQVGWKLQEVWRRIERYFGHILSLGASSLLGGCQIIDLREVGPGIQQRHYDEAGT